MKHIILSVIISLVSISIFAHPAVPGTDHPAPKIDVNTFIVQPPATVVWVVKK